MQVWRSEQSVFRSGADARRAGESVGHVGRLPGEHLCEGAAAAPGSLCHHLLPARLSPPEREQIQEVPGKGNISVSKKNWSSTASEEAGMISSAQTGAMREMAVTDGKLGCGWEVCTRLRVTRRGVFCRFLSLWEKRGQIPSSTRTARCREIAAGRRRTLWCFNITWCLFIITMDNS